MATTPITPASIVEHAQRLISDRLARVRAYEQACMEGRTDGDRCAILIDTINDVTDIQALASLLFAHGAFDESKSLEQGAKYISDIGIQTAYRCRMACIGRAPWQQQATAEG